MRSLLLLASALLANAIELTPDNWDEETAGKTVFIKFLAPWCGHCKKMKPDWDKLMKEDFGPNALIADVDCTAEGEPLCNANGVKGFPTLKWGDPSALEDYSGGRGFAELKKFAKENLKPMCSPANIDLCDDEKKAEINKLMEMDGDALEKLIEEKEKLLDEAEETFKAEVQKLQDKYQELMSAKEKTEEEVKDSGLSLMRSVKAAKQKKAESKDEL